MKAKLVPSLCVLISLAILPIASAKTVSVDCTKGQKVQDAVDKAVSPVTIEIHGICIENVNVVGKDVVLKGADPATDGIQGVNDPAVTGALTLNKVVLGSILNLSISNGPRGGVALFDSQVDIQNCRMIGNAVTGLHVSAGSFATGTNITSSQNGSRGVQVQRASQFSCEGCRFENNASYAASALSGSTCLLADSLISGPFGLQSNAGGSVAELGCSAPPTTPCSMTITKRAALAAQDGRVTLFNIGDFQGILDAMGGGNLTIGGSRQLPSGAPPPAPYLVNHVGDGGMLTVTDYVDELDADHAGQIALPTSVTRFGRFVASGVATLAGSVQCFSAGDASVDATVTKNAGITITGCEHAVFP
jgi:hypothetical protein